MSESTVSESTADRVGLWLGAVVAVAALLPGGGLLVTFGPNGWWRLVAFSSRHGLWHFTFALIVVLVLPLLVLGGLLLAWRRPRQVWPFVTGVLVGIVTVCLLVPRWPNIVPDAGWWLLALSAAVGLTSVYLLVQRALR